VTLRKKSLNLSSLSFLKENWYYLLED
jgi:hypothetical protein